MTDTAAVVRRRILLAAAAVLGLAWAVGGETIALVRDFGDNHLLNFLCGLAFIWSGLFALDRRPGNIIGWLLVGWGFLFYLEVWATLLPPRLEALAAVPVAAAGALIIHIGVVYPTGRAVTRFGVVVIVVAYTWDLVMGFLVEAFFDRTSTGCTSSHYCRATLSLWPSAQGEATALVLMRAGTVVLIALVAIAIWQRWRLSPAAERADLHPVWIALVVLGGAVALNSIGALVGLSGRWARAVGDFQTVAELAAPLVIVYGLVHGRVAELARQNGALAATVQEQLRDVRESRARIVAAGDAERRRVEHNLHDGAQQRLLSVILILRSAELEAEEGSPALSDTITRAETELRAALDELRELARGIHPAILTDAGLGPALRALADRSPVAVAEVEAPDVRMPGPVEVTAYFVVAEALSNVVKHADAASVRIHVQENAGMLEVVIADDGVGHADTMDGAGLRGLADRVAAIGGTFAIDSAPGSGTTVRATIPLEAVPT